MGSLLTPAHRDTTQGKKDNNNNSTKMALFHFKHEAMEDEIKKQKEMNMNLVNPMMFAGNNMQTSNCQNHPQDLRFGGLDLGDIMRQTIMAEMKLISLENEMGKHRMGGS